MNSEELRAKRANRERVREFAKNLQSFNRKVIDHSRLVQISNDCVDGGHAPVVAEESSRERALKFAQRIPRPILRNNKSTNISDRRSEEGRKAGRDVLVSDEEQKRQSRLLELEAKHSYDRERVRNIRKSLGL